MNDHENGAAIVFPAVSFTPLTVAVYVVDAANAADGVNVAVFEPALYAEVPATGVDPAASEKPTDADCTGSEKLAVGAVVAATFVAPAAGDVAVTVGGVVSTGGAAAVVNDQEKGAAIWLPAVSRTPEIVAVKVVDAASAADGVNVAVFEPAL